MISLRHFNDSKWRYRRLFLILLMLPTWCLASVGDPILEGWPINANGIIFGAPAIGPEGQVVFGTLIGSDQFSADGSVYCVNPNGTIRWKYDGTDWFDSSPAIAADGTVYIGCWDNYLYALDGNTIKLGPEDYLWRFDTETDVNGLPVAGGPVIATPTIGPDGTIYAGSINGVMFAIYPDGQLRWNLETDENLSPISGQAVLDTAGSTLFFGTDAGVLNAVDAATGTQIWSYAVPESDDLLTRPGQRAIIGSPVPGNNGEIYFSCENGILYEITRSTGELSSRFPAEDSIFSSPIITENSAIYFASRDGYLYAVTTDPALGIMVSLWEVFVGDVFYCTPALDMDGNILVGAYAGDSQNPNRTNLTAVSPTGNILWTRTIEALNDSSPNIAPDGSILIGAHDGNLYKFEGGSPLARKSWPRFGGNRRQTGWSADVDSIALVDYFPEIEYTFAGLSYVDWFGEGFINETALPQIQHDHHGQLYMAQSDPEGVIYYDYQLAAWMFAPLNAPNHYLMLAGQRWLYHAQPTTTNTGRWFYDLDQQVWVLETDL